MRALPLASSTGSNSQSPSLDCECSAIHCRFALTVLLKSYPSTLHRAIDNGLRLTQRAQFLPWAYLIASCVVEFVDEVSRRDILHVSSFTGLCTRGRYAEGLHHDS